MSGLRLLCLGCGDAFSARWYSSCLALESDGAWLLIDCPHPIRKVLRESGDAAGVPLDVADVSGLVLTHLHADHASGVEGWLFYSHYRLRRRAALLAHAEVARPLWDHHLAPSMTTAPPTPDSPDPAPPGREAFLDLLELRDDAPVRFGPFTLECRRTRHSVPTFALRIQAGGRRLGYSADTPFDPDLLAWLADGADLVVHETNLGPVHTSYERLASLPPELRSRLRLIHYPDDFDPTSSLIEPLRQGALYEV